MKKRTEKEIKKDIETYNQLIEIFETQKDPCALARAKISLQKAKTELNGIKK